MEKIKQILKVTGITALILILGFLLFKISSLESQEPQEKIIYFNQTLNYSDEELRGEIKNLKEMISDLKEQLNETNSILWNITHPPKEKSKDSGSRIDVINEPLEIMGSGGYQLNTT